MYNKIYIGQNAAGVFAAPAFAPISRIALLVDDENEYLSGDDTGRTLEVTCPYGSQAMADDLLAQLKGYAYQPMTAQDALLDPAAEIGDGVTVGGVYTILAQIDRLFDMHCAADIAAPGEEELESEYTFQTQEKRLERKLAQTRSLISKTAEEIRLEVAGVEDEISYIQLDLESITSRVQDAEGNISTLEQTATSLRSEISGKLDGDEAQSLIDQTLESIELSVSSSKGSTTFTLTSDGVELSSETLNLSVNAVNISGKLTAKQIDATDLKVDVANITGTLRIGDLEDDVGLVTEDNVTTITNRAIKTAKISADQVTSGTLYAASLALDGAMELTLDGERYGWMGINNYWMGPTFTDATGNTGLIVTTDFARLSWNRTNELRVDEDGCWYQGALNEYSDRRLKNNINYDLSKEEKFFSLLRACSFCMNDDEKEKIRWGFIAQDVIEAAAAAGLDAEGLAALSKSKKMYGLAYGQFTALNTHMIQILMARVAELEASV